MNRSEIRHALYRAKNNIIAPEKQYIYDMVSKLLPVNESFATFANRWDVFVSNDTITIIKPEVDYDFIHTTCLEKALHVKNNIDMELTDRQSNALQIVELNMLDGKMEWDTYNKTWGVFVDTELKRIHTKLFRTVINEVTEEMIQSSAQSDGAAMQELPSIPIVTLSDPVVMNDSEIEEFNDSVKKSKKTKINGGK